MHAQDILAADDCKPFRVEQLTASIGQVETEWHELDCQEAILDKELKRILISSVDTGLDKIIKRMAKLARDKDQVGTVLCELRSREWPRFHGDKHRGRLYQAMGRRLKAGRSSIARWRRLLWPLESSWMPQRSWKPPK